MFSVQISTLVQTDVPEDPELSSSNQLLMHKMQFNNSTVMNSTEDISMSVRTDLPVPLLGKTLAEVTGEVGLVVAATVVVGTVEEVSEVDMDVVAMVEEDLEEVDMEVVAMEVGVTEVEDMVGVEVGVGIMTVDMVVVVVVAEQGDRGHIHMHPSHRMNSLIPLQLVVSPLLLFLCQM